MLIATTKNLYRQKLIWGGIRLILMFKLLKYLHLFRYQYLVEF